MTSWTAACQASLSITNPQSLLKLLAIKLVMPSNQLILCCPLLLLPSIFPSIRVFSNKLVLCVRWPKYWSFSFGIGPTLMKYLDSYFFESTYIIYALNLKKYISLDIKWQAISGCTSDVNICPHTLWTYILNCMLGWINELIKINWKEFACIKQLIKYYRLGKSMIDLYLQPPDIGDI